MQSDIYVRVARADKHPVPHHNRREISKSRAGTETRGPENAEGCGLYESNTSSQKMTIWVYENIKVNRVTCVRGRVGRCGSMPGGGG